MLMNDYPTEFVPIEYHVGDSYQVPYSVTRANFYGVSGVPTTWFDGILQRAGSYDNDQQMYNWYLGAINSRLAVATDVTIEISASEVDAQVYEVSATIAIDEGGVGKNLTVHLVQVLDYYPSYADKRYRNTARQATAETDITLAAGESTTITPAWGQPSDPHYPYLYLGGVDWTNREDVKLVCFARVPGSSAPKEVYNANYLDWPIVSVPGDINGDGRVDLIDLGMLLANYNLCPGDAGYNPAANVNDDDGTGCINLADLGVVLAHYGEGT
jgi:hypothetical protein